MLVLHPELLRRDTIYLVSDSVIANCCETEITRGHIYTARKLQSQNVCWIIFIRTYLVEKKKHNTRTTSQQTTFCRKKKREKRARRNSQIWKEKWKQKNTDHGNSPLLLAGNYQDNQLLELRTAVPAKKNGDDNKPSPGFHYFLINSI